MIINRSSSDTDTVLLIFKKCSDHLDLDMPGTVNKLLHQHPVITEGGSGLKKYRHDTEKSFLMRIGNVDMGGDMGKGKAKGKGKGRGT